MIASSSPFATRFRSPKAEGPLLEAVLNNLDNLRLAAPERVGSITADMADKSVPTGTP